MRAAAIGAGLAYLCAIALNIVSLHAEALFVALFATILGASIPAHRVPGRTLSLESFAFLTMGAYALAVPVSKLLLTDVGLDRHGVYIFSLLMLSLVGLSFGIAAVPSYQVPDDRSLSMSGSYIGEYRAGVFIFWFGLFSALVAAAFTVGLGSYLTAGYGGRSLIKREFGPIELGLYWAIVGLLAANQARLLDPHLKRRKRSWNFVALGTLGFVAYVSMLGVRRPSFMLATGLLFSFSFAGRGLKKSRLILFGFPLILIFGTFAQYRQVLSDHGSTAALEYVGDNLSWDWLDLSESELGAPFTSLSAITEWEDSPRLGMTYLVSVPNLVPGSLGFEVISEEYTRREFDARIIAIGGNYAISPAAEGFVNFREAGVLLAGLAIGFLVAFAQRRLLRRPTFMGGLVFALLGPWTMLFFRTDWSAFVKSAAYSLGPAFVGVAILTSPLAGGPRGQRLFAAGSFEERGTQVPS